MYSCPIDNNRYKLARDVISCWHEHMPDLFSLFTLSQIGEKIGGVSRERVRQIANSMDITERKRDFGNGLRGKEAEKVRKKNMNKWKSNK